MTTAALSLAQTDCTDLRRKNDVLQQLNDIYAGRCARLLALLEMREREIAALTAENAELHEQLHAHVVDGLPY